MPLYERGSQVTLQFFHHRTGQYATLELGQRELILQLIKHIPEKHFRMIYYFCFLANQMMGEKLPLIRKSLGQEDAPFMKKMNFDELSQTLLETDPFSCNRVAETPGRSKADMN